MTVIFSSLLALLRGEAGAKQAANLNGVRRTLRVLDAILDSKRGRNKKAPVPIGKTTH